MRVISQPSEPGDPSSIPSFPGNADTSTQTPPPADGGVIWNNATQASATEIYVSATDLEGNDIKQTLLEYPKTKDVFNIRTQASTDTYQQWEIVNITDQGTYVEYDVMLIEENGGNIADGESIVIGFDLKYDENAIHKNIANEIQGLVNKPTAVSADVILLEDSADSFNKKKITVGQLLPNASETVSGIIEIATQAETDAGLDDTRAVTPLKMATYINANAVLNPLTADLITAGYKISNTAVSGNVIFSAGSGFSGQNGGYRFLDASNPATYIELICNGNGGFYNIIGIYTQHLINGSMVFECTASEFKFNKNVRPFGNSRRFGNNSNHWLAVHAQTITHSTDGGILNITSGSASLRGETRFPDSTDSSKYLYFQVGGSTTINTANSGLLRLGVNGNPEVLTIQSTQIVYSSAFIPDGDKTRNIGGSSRHINILYASRIINAGSTLNLESGNGFDITINAGNTSSRANVLVRDRQTLNNRGNLVLSTAIDNTTKQVGVVNYTAMRPASDSINALSATGTTIYTAPTGHKISPNWVKIKALSGAFTSDVTVSVGTTGNLTKYLNNVPLFGATPAIGEVVKININDPDDVDDLIVTVNVAATGTSPKLRAWHDSEVMEDE